MRKIRKILFSLITLASAFALSACGSGALDLTDEEIERVVNYSANVLERYNSHQKGTLADVSDTSLAVLLEEEDIQAAEEARRAARREQHKQEAENKENGGEGSGEDGAGVNNNPLIDSNANEFTSIAELLGISGFSIDYTGYDIVDSYPESVSENDLMFGINAGNGDSLLVLRFNVRNLGSETAHCSVLDKNPAFKLKINGDRHSFLKTLLMDDLATFDEDMEGGETKEAVLVAEVSTAKASQIETLVLTLRNSDGDNQMILQGSDGQVAAPAPAPASQAEETGDEQTAEEAQEGSDEADALADLEAFDEEYGDILENGETAADEN